MIAIRGCYTLVLYGFRVIKKGTGKGAAAKTNVTDLNSQLVLSGIVVHGGRTANRNTKVCTTNRLLYASYQFVHGVSSTGNNTCFATCTNIRL